MPVFEALGPDGFRTYSVDLQTGSFEVSDAASEGLLVPGFVDLHIHGAFGYDFMSGSQDDLRSMADGLTKAGYEAFLPTTVTGSADEIQRAIGHLVDDPRTPGFHLEGPFISPKQPGAQPLEAITVPTPEWDAILDDPRLRLVTLASEIEGGLELVRRLARRGVIPSLGHTDATFDQVGEAVAAGARHTTHTYNAMRPLHHREAGTVGAALLTPALTCELIYDRIHVSRPAADLLLRSKGPGSVIAVSDGTMAAGLPTGTRLSMWGHDCVVGDGDVRLTSGGLAGSAITLADAFRNLAQDFGVEIAIRLSCINPRRALGMGAPRVWLIMDREFRVVERLPRA